MRFNGDPVCVRGLGFRESAFRVLETIILLQSAPLLTAVLILHKGLQTTNIQGCKHATQCARTCDEVLGIRLDRCEGQRVM